MSNSTLKSFLTAAILCLLAASFSYAQNSSTIYFYRTNKSSGNPYEVMDGNTSVGRVFPGTVKVYQCGAGAHEFVATGKNRSSFRLDTEAGKEYFVRCDMTNDSTQRATFRIARKGDSRMEIKKINEVVASKISATVITTSADTVRALRHLFKRKRGWGIAFLIGGGLAAIRNSLALITYEPEQIPIGYGQTIEHNARPSLVFGLLGGLTFTGIGVSRLPYYKHERLDAILEDRADGAPFPDKVMKRLKRRDFQATVSSISQ